MRGAGTALGVDHHRTFGFAPLRLLPISPHPLLLPLPAAAAARPPTPRLAWLRDTLRGAEDANIFHISRFANVSLSLRSSEVVKGRQKASPLHFVVRARDEPAMQKGVYFLHDLIDAVATKYRERYPPRFR